MHSCQLKLAAQTGKKNFKIKINVTRSNMAKTSQNGPFCARTPHNFPHMHFIDLKLFSSFSSQFFLSGKYPLDMFYRNSIFHSAIVFKKFTARIYRKESAAVII